MASEPMTRRRRLVPELGWAVAAAVVSTLSAAIALRVTPAALTERWQVGGDDQILHYLLFRSATQSFPFAENGALGFPDGFNAFFTAQFDVASALIAAALALVIHDGFLLLNVFHLLTFALVALTGYAFFRCLRTPPWTAALVATLFSLAPYHFLRLGAGHAFLANYWAIPLLGTLVLTVAGERTDPFRAWIARAANRRARVLRGAVPVVVLPLLIASSGGYYYVFSLLVLAGVWLLGALAAVATRARVRDALLRALPLLALGGLVGVELLLLGGGYGERTARYFESRGPGESETFGGKILTLFLPWQGTQVPKIGALTNMYENATAVAKATEPTGMPVLGIVGLCLLLVSLPLVGLAGGRALRATAFGRLVSDERLRVLATATLWTLLFYVITGFGMAVAVFASTTVRAWSRLSIVLVLFALGAVAVVLARLSGRWVRTIVVAGVIVVAIADQLAGVARFVPLSPTEDDEMAALVDETEQALPDGCGVVQLPVKSFPDSGRIGAMADYDEALPYLYTEEGQLEWSYGAIRGTTGFEVFGDVETPQEFAAAVESSDACAIYVDTAAYTEQVGAWQDDVLAASGSLTPLASSSSGRWLVFAVPR
ncbi:hypothetical protein GSU68_12200 [Rathayibacter sp. VKM Ac-2759]|uniref:hypothetical protein n=1 Tax=Rathayibacter sp. VKM Ac-2759 TaxID=2609252 RepID=UPI0013189D95|nr:hypothetical protein [Rathayibacter sp. VKM Ac-2759]QHC67250.1 hypothetical protein GSU68_12200 [Rathayibacter sp. VKM Ac-2759]